LANAAFWPHPFELQNLNIAIRMRIIQLVTKKAKYLALQLSISKRAVVVIKAVSSEAMCFILSF